MSNSAQSEKKVAHSAEAKRKTREKRDDPKDEPPQNPDPPQNNPKPQLEIYAVNYNFIRAPWLRI